MDEEKVEVRQSAVVEENEESIDQREEVKEELFDNLKVEFLNQQRLLGRFYEFSSQHGEFEYDETGDNHEEGDEFLRYADKIRDKLLLEIEKSTMLVFQNLDTNTLTNIIGMDVEKDGEKFRVVVEVFENSFNLEIL